MEKYVMVTFPEIQDFREHKRWGECIFCQAIDGHPCPDSTYMVPEGLYRQVKGTLSCSSEIVEHLGETFIVEGEEAVLVGYNNYNGDCIVSITSETSDLGWKLLDEDDIILYEVNSRKYWYASWTELKESRSE